LAGNPELSNWLWLVPVSMFIFAVFEASSNWCTRKKKFGEISASVVANRLTTVGSQAALASAGPRTATSGLLIGHVIGDILGAILIVRRSISRIDKNHWQTMRSSRTIKLLKIYGHFPTYGLMSSVVSAVVRALPVLLLGYFFTPAIVGFYALANQMVAGPAQLITGAIFRVFFERANRAKQEGNLDQMVVRLYSKLCGMLMTPLGLLSIAAPTLTEWILGAGWIQTGIFLRWIAILVFFTATVGPLHRVFQILGKQRELAMLQSLSFAGGTAALAAGGIYGQPNSTIASYAIVMASIFSFQAARVLAISGARKAAAILLPARELLRSAPYFAVMMATIYITDNKPTTLAIFVGLLGLFAALRFRTLVDNRN
jgi:O-antigen/teichoic acid export membrane protein